MKHHCVYIGLILGCAILAGCQGYAYSVNEQAVYTPAQLFSDFQVPDTNLSTCIRQSIADQKAIKAQQLTSLRCSHAGISSLLGIEQFPGLTQIDLRGNPINSFSPLLSLPSLREVYLESENASHCEPLNTLKEKGVKIFGQTICQI